MDIVASKQLFEGLKKFNEEKGKPYGNSILDAPPANPKFPLVIFDEIRNVSTTINSNFDRVASVGYVVRVYAKTKGNKSKKQIAREIAQLCDDFLSQFLLSRNSFNTTESLNDDSIYEIVVTYSGSLHENRRNFI